MSWTFEGIFKTQTTIIAVKEQNCFRVFVGKVEEIKVKKLFEIF